MTYRVLESTQVAVDRLKRVPEERLRAVVLETMSLLRPICSWSSRGQPQVLDAFDRALSSANNLARGDEISPGAVHALVEEVAMSDAAGASSMTMEVAGVLENGLLLLAGAPSVLRTMVEADLQLVAYVEARLTRVGVPAAVLDRAALSLSAELQRILVAAGQGDAVPIDGSSADHYVRNREDALFGL